MGYHEPNAFEETYGVNACTTQKNLNVADFILRTFKKGKNKFQKKSKKIN